MNCQILQRPSSVTYDAIYCEPLARIAAVGFLLEVNKMQFSSYQGHHKERDLRRQTVKDMLTYSKELDTLMAKC